MRLPKWTIQPEDLDPDGLEKVVTAHARFHAHSRTFSSHSPRDPLSWSSEWSVRCVSEELAGPVNTIRLLPGGRFLLVIISANVQLWDLGFGPGKSKCLASENLNIILMQDMENEILIQRVWVRDEIFTFTILQSSTEIKSVFITATFYGTDETTCPGLQP